MGYGISNCSQDIYYGSLSKGYSGTGRHVITFTTPESFRFDPPYVWFRLARMASNGSLDVDVSNILLEEGSAATEYESYYITSTTTVAQTNNHTLTARFFVK